MTPYKFFVTINIFLFFLVSSLSALSYFFWFTLSKRENHNVNKEKRKQIWKSKTASHTASIWIKEARNKSGMTKKSCRACWIRLGQLYIIFYRKRSVFYRVWLNSKTLTHVNGPTLPTPKFYEPMLPTAPTPSTNPRYPHHSRYLADSINAYWLQWLTSHCSVMRQIASIYYIDYTLIYVHEILKTNMKT